MKKILVSLIVLVGGCSSSTDPIESIAGTYVLETVDGTRLPVQICPEVNAPYKVEVLSGQFEITAPNSWKSSSHTRTTWWEDYDWKETEVEEHDGHASGTFTIAGDSIFLTTGTQAPVAAYFSGGILRLEQQCPNIYASHLSTYRR